MKVLKDGRDSWSKEVMCHGCNSTLEFGFTDVSVRHYTGRSQITEKLFEIVCPICQKVIEVNSILMYEMRDAIQDKYSTTNKVHNVR